MKRSAQTLTAQDRLAAEHGTIRKDATERVALCYPSPYRVAMSSLGYQQLYRILNAEPDIAADRGMLPDPTSDEPLLTLERRLPLSSYRIVAFSVAYELEIAGLVECLDKAKIPALAKDRGPRDPMIIAGGPLTFSNPVPLAPFCDVIVMGEGDELGIELVRLIRDCGYDRDRVIAEVAGRPGFYVPARDGDAMPPVVAAGNENLPARSQIITPHTELSSMYLTEAARGCSRGCTYCVMRRSTNGGMRIIAPEVITDAIPEGARRVGLVGAAVTDHPRVSDIVRRVVESGREVGISSLRADKLSDELVELLARGGYRTLTVAGDGASEAMRRKIERSTTEKHLLESARLAAKHKMRTVKIYMMVGVPGETDDDIDELCRFSRELRKMHPRIAYGVAPFVAKRRTPLDGTDFAGIDLVRARLERLRRGIRGVATMRPTSARWAWVEYMLAQGTSAAGLAAMDAYRAGGSFAAYKRAFQARGVEPTGPVARVPSTSEIIALRKAQRPR